MESYELKSVFFKNLKGLKNANFVFNKPLTAIMGVNGSGKTTVIHALACAYQPTEGGNGENHKFSDFFVPNTDALWRGSEFYVEMLKTIPEKGIQYYLKENMRRHLTDGYHTMKVGQDEMCIT